jgi:hypothetical protein
MDELHRSYRKIGGYNCTGITVSSRGYCDDTTILAEDETTIKKMNS